MYVCVLVKRGSDGRGGAGVATVLQLPEIVNKLELNQAEVPKEQELAGQGV